MTAKNTKHSVSKNDAPQVWTYDTAPARVHELSGIPVSTRQLRTWVWEGKVSYARVGNRVMFTDDHLRELVESFTVRAAR